MFGNTARISGAFVLSAMLCTGAAHAAPPLQVVSSFSIITDMAQQVGGDRVRITTLVGRDGDAHVYEPKPADAVAISAADVVLTNGLQFEGFLPRLVAASNTRAPIVELTDGIDVLLNQPDDHDHDHSHGHGHEHHHGKYDPHAWQSVRNAQIYVRNIAAAFCAADEQGCATYEANAHTYSEALAALDDDIHEAIAAIPPEKRTVITSHDAFNYFQRDYGIRVLAAEGLSTEAEASAADIAALIRQIRTGHASAVFVENISNPRLAEQIAREAGVAVGGTLYSDALSKPGGQADTYVDMMRANIKTITSAISGA